MVVDFTIARSTPALLILLFGSSDSELCSRLLLRFNVIGNADEQVPGASSAPRRDGGSSDSLSVHPSLLLRTTVSKLPPSRGWHREPVSDSFWSQRERRNTVTAARIEYFTKIHAPKGHFLFTTAQIGRARTMRAHDPPRRPQPRRHCVAGTKCVTFARLVYDDERVSQRGRKSDRRWFRVGVNRGTSEYRLGWAGRETDAWNCRSPSMQLTACFNAFSSATRLERVIEYKLRTTEC